MSKNLILVQNGFPGSKTSGTATESLTIKNFFKYEADVFPTDYIYLSNSSYNTSRNIRNAYYTSTSTISPNNSFLRYSISPLLFAIRMSKGHAASNINISSRLNNDDLSLLFLPIGTTTDSFKALNKYNFPSCSSPTLVAGRAVKNYNVLQSSINIADLKYQDGNYCFLAFLYSTTAHNMDSGSILLDNSPLLNISWTETSFVEE